MAEKYLTHAFEAFSQPAASSSQRLGSLQKIYPQFVPRNREDYPHAVDEDDFDASVLPVPTMVPSQGPSTEDGFDILDDETSFDCCHSLLCDPDESAQYFNDEDLFERLNTDSDYFQQAGDHEQEDSEEELSEEDMLFGSGWDSDDTVTNARLVIRHTHRERIHTEAEEIADVALREHIYTATEDGAQYFDADDLFEREEAEMLVYGRDEEIHWYSEDWDFAGKERDLLDAGWLNEC